MIITGKKKESFELQLLELERDRATGIEVEIHLKRKSLSAKFFHLWIEKEELSKFIGGLKKLINGRVASVALNSPKGDDLYLVLMKKNDTFFLGIKVEAYNFTPIKIKDTVMLCFEANPETIPPFIKELETIRSMF
jgi:hypothetical protein